MAPDMAKAEDGDDKVWKIRGPVEWAREVERLEIRSESTADEL